MADDRYERTTFHGKTVDNITKAMLQEAEHRLGYELTILQGSFSTAVAQSAGTHNKGGVVDLAPYDWRNKLRVWKNVGGFGWHRPRIAGLWGEHLHLGVLGHKNMADAAERQETSYLRGHDGLKDDGPDPTPWRPTPLVHFAYPVKATTRKPIVKTRMTELRDAVSLAIGKASAGAAHNTGTRKARFLAAEKTLRAIMASLPKS